MYVRLLNYTLCPDQAVASAAAICHGVPHAEVSQWSKEQQQQLISKCLNAGHWAVLEFAELDFEVQDISKALETQLVRSRIGSYMFESGRREQGYYPADIVLDDMKNRGLYDEVWAGISRYRDLVSSGVSAEDARYALPQGVARKGRIKKNFRAWVETAQERMCSKALPEYQLFMEQVKKEVGNVYGPFWSNMLVAKCTRAFYCNEEKSCRRDGCRTKREVVEIVLEAERRSNPTTVLPL